MGVPLGASGDDDGSARRALEEIVVVATREASPMHVVPYSVHRIDREDLQRGSFRNLPQALRYVPGVMVQETAFGQGSPFIRGFTGFRNLFLIDEVRLNNPVFRDGPNQYWSTIDAFALDRIEVVNGPTSTLYGSDAIGGTVNAVTSDPFTADSRMLYRHSAAEHSDIVRLDYASPIGDRAAVHLGVTGKNYGALRGGDNLGTQPETGYDEYDIDLKLSARLAGGWRSDVYWNGVRQNNVPRTHSTAYAKSWHGTSVGSDLQRDLDQERTLGYLRVSNDELSGAVDRASFTVSHSSMDEVRDRIRSGNRRDLQGFDIATVGVLAQFASETSAGRLVYGIDHYTSDVGSFSSRNPIQGPVGDDAEYDGTDFYLQDRIDLSERLALVLGARHTRVELDARSVSDPITGERIRVRDDWHKTVGNANVSYAFVEDKLIGFFGVSQAFRAPNLSDATRFDSARTNEFETPSPGLQPEEFLSMEAGIKWRGPSGHLSVALFDTEIDGMIQRVPTGRELDGEFEITKANVGDGWVRGVEIAGDWSVSPNLKLLGNLTWMDGEVDTFTAPDSPIVAEPIDRLMPLMGSVGLLWQSDDRLWWEGRIQYATAQDDLSTRDQGDTSRIPPGGTPGYVAMNLGGGLRLGEHTTLNLVVDNVLNEDYRIHGSGTNMPGRNVMVSIEAGF